MSCDSPSSLTRFFVPDRSAPAAARSALGALGGNLDAELRERSELVLTEVMTNSVLHAGLTPTQRIGLEVSLSSELLRIELTDDGLGFAPVPAASKPDQAAGGWGLWLVDQLTDRWGVDFSRSSRVWLEFDRALSRPGERSAA